MLRSPISPASFCTLARSSSRSATSSGDSGAAFKIFLPGILTPNHQSNAKTAATAIAMRRALKRSDRNTAGTHLCALRNFSPKPQRAETEQQDRHHHQDNKILPVFEERRAAQNDRAHERDKIRRGKEGAERIENPRHGLPWENESGKEDAW